MFVVLLNAVLATIFIVIAGILTLVAIGLIIGSLVRASKAKKENRKTHKVGLWVGIAMIVIPWIFVAALLVGAKIYDANNNRWIPNREILATPVAVEDAQSLHDMMADDVVARNNITVNDVEKFLDQCDLSNVDADNLGKYTDMGAPQTNHYRNYTSKENGRSQTCFQYNMYDVNNDGWKIYITGVDGDSEGEEYVGIYYIAYMRDDEVVYIGEKPPSE